MLDKLNSQQRQAVQHTDTPLLVLAGAGSGKTRVITQKIAYLITQQDIPARHIAAVTFTNKAAREMRQRVKQLLPGKESSGLRVSTFHTLGLNIIAKEYKKLGYKAGYSLFDSHDSRSLIQELLRKEGNALDQLEDTVHWQISHWKNAHIAPEQAMAQAQDGKQQHAARIYERYNHYLKTYNAMDFDDLIGLPIQLFEQDESSLGAWRERIRYLLVDEYQDTNTAQYQLVKLLVGPRRGLTVVGDDDQSVYGWRGAQPENLHLLQLDFNDLTVIKLEQNYRSVGNILRAANSLIANNSHQFEKRLWSDMGPGESLRVLKCRNADHEAERVVSHLLHHRFKYANQYSDYAILYRGNHQSRPFERMLREHQIPYYLSGGLSFFERTEIKDLMAYLRLIANPDDDAAFLRAINTPRRGLGPATVESINNHAQTMETSLLSAAQASELQQGLSARAQAPLQEFVQWIDTMSRRSEDGNPTELVKALLTDIDYEGWIQEQSPTPQSAERRLENVHELVDWLGRLSAKDPTQSSLAELLAKITLIDLLERSESENTADAVHLMTLHAAKGLEFDHVFMVGMEEDLLPHRNSIEHALEEERRLAYVGITRARKSLTFSLSSTRRRYGEVSACEPSRFLEELPQDNLSWEGGSDEDPQQRKERGQAHLAHLRNLLTE